ncbi:uncharacterized protein [Ptychodera flava]|uniref:uncharacterized protein n=1 Tax=Ptychodera flava TaxID=63121 RepID=UPI00396A914E
MYYRTDRKKTCTYCYFRNARGGSIRGNGYDDRQDVTHNSDNKMYDIYTICSQWDDDWVKDRLIPAVQIGLHERVHVRVNIYEQTEMNAMFMKSCRINIVIISKHSLRDDRFNEDREIAYAHRTASKVIHVILDQSESVQEIEGDLQQISKCFDFSVDDKPFEKLTDYMGTML